MDRRVVKVALAAALIILAGCRKSPEDELRKRLAVQKTGTLNLPPGVIPVSSELVVREDAHDLDIVGSGTILKPTDEFKGRAVLVVEGVENLRLRDFSIDGNRIVLERKIPAAPAETALRSYYQNNGVLLDRVSNAEISNLTLANIANLAILVSRSFKVKMHHLRVEDNGSLDPQGHSNGTGGIVIEDGSSAFEVRSSALRRLRGNGLWIFSPSKVNEDGVIANNRFDAIGRDAILIWNTRRVRVEENSGSRIGYPAEAVDPVAQPVALAAFGDVDHATFSKNQFDEIDGKCIDLDGFHDGNVLENQCVNRRPPSEYPFGHFGIVMNNTHVQPANIEIAGNTIDGARYGGLFLIGSGHRISKNRFLHLNSAGCHEAGEQGGCVYLKEEPKMLESGIYFGRGGAQPAQTRNNTIRENVISGFKMQSRCTASAPSVTAGGTIAGNRCSDYSLAP
jgi:hypothetical protein